MTTTATPEAAQPAAPRLLTLGDGCWIVEFGHAIDPDLHARVLALTARVEAERDRDPALAPITDVVPTFRSLAVHVDALALEAGLGADALGQRLLAWASEAGGQAVDGAHWRLPVCFDAEFAPDLGRVAELSGLSPEAVMQRLLDTRFRVYVLGFLPGFGYMGGLPPELAVPRLPSPRQKVPAQSLAIAAGMGGIYPWDSPGGWNLLGRTPVRLFDLAETQQPSMLAAGDVVRLKPVDRAEHDELVKAVSRGLPRNQFLEAAR